MSAEEIRETEQRLSDLGYWTGPVDGVLDEGSRQALIAFQKVEDRQRTGKLTPDELQALRTANRQPALESGYTHIEIDLSRQVLFAVDVSGSVSKILPVSTGTGKLFTSEGRTRRAVTPSGRFTISHKILLIASLASFLLGERLTASIIVFMVLLSVALNFFQTYRSERAAERLRQQVAPTATALRDGEWIEVLRRNVVPGDVIRLLAGDLVPADARLLEAKDLHVNQASLTGESLPAEKEALVDELTKQDSCEDRGLVFLGTSVVSGTATAAVLATGRATAFGDIAARLAARPPETEFERGTRAFGLLIMKTVFFLVAFVFLASAALRHEPFESLVFAIVLAVGLTPEFLPMITTVTLGQGAVHMARQKVIVKHLEAIQNFGSMDVLCSDKTGTLTSGSMISSHSS